MSYRTKKIGTTFSILFILLIAITGLTGCGKATEDNAVSEQKNDTDTSAPVDPKEQIDSEDSDTEEEKDTSMESPKPSEEDTSKPSNDIQAIYYGDFVINQIQAFGVGTYSEEDAKSLLGKSLSFGKDSATHFGDNLTDIEKVSTDPVYTETDLSEYDFVTNYRIPFENLGIEADTITGVEVTNLEGHVCSFLIKDENTLILYGGGTYFELVRKEIYEANNMLGYIRSIDIANKTITVDKVEFLLPSDEKRLSEIGMTSDDLVTGFYIHNEEEVLETISYHDTVRVELYNETTLAESTIQELEFLLFEGGVLCDIKLEDTKAIQIRQRYLP